MSNIKIDIENIKQAYKVFDTLKIQRSLNNEYGPYEDISDISIASDKSVYRYFDAGGNPDYWYRAKLYCSGCTYKHPCVSGSETDWFDPVRGDSVNLYFNPVYPDESFYENNDYVIINKIRELIGDKIELKREYGEDTVSSIHPDGRTYELDHKGWPVCVIMNGKNYVDINNPVVDDYRYLYFNEDMVTTTTVSGVDYNIDIWYKSFRHSDREIMEAYDNTTPPPLLSEKTAPKEAYLLQAAMDLLLSESLQDAVEDGAQISGDGSSYSPGAGFSYREQLMTRIQKRIDDLVRMHIFRGLSGVVID